MPLAVDTLMFSARGKPDKQLIEVAGQVALYSYMVDQSLTKEVCMLYVRASFWIFLTLLISNCMWDDPRVYRERERSMPPKIAQQRVPSEEARPNVAFPAEAAL